MFICKLPYRHIICSHTDSFLGHKYIININEDVTIQRDGDSAQAEVGYGIKEEQAVQPEVQVTPKQHPGDSVKVTFVLQWH